jgi:hypothetical protein
MGSILRERFSAVKEDLSAKKRPAGWVLPREPGSFTEEGTWWVNALTCARFLIL